MGNNSSRSIWKYIRKFWESKHRNITLATIFLLLWLFFFSPNTLRNQYLAKKELQELMKTKAFYEKEIQKDRATIEKLKTDLEYAEKYGREEYLMKKQNEDIFLFVEEEKKD